MATTKNIIMKQFNGTDYDTLYPKTKVEQVENLTPSSIGAVSKTGDTMTGNLMISKEIPSLLLAIPGKEYRSEFLKNAASAVDLGTIISDVSSSSGENYSRIVLCNATKEFSYQIVDSGKLTGAYHILHTGNAQSLGFPKIATGSYVGTGYSGQSHPMSINVGFAPKLFWICLKLRDKDGVPVAYTIPGGGVQEDNGLFINPFTRYYCSQGSTSRSYVTVTWGSTMSWYGYVDFDDTEHGEYQFNEAGVTYYWVAIG